VCAVCLWRYDDSLGYSLQASQDCRFFCFRPHRKMPKRTPGSSLDKSGQWLRGGIVAVLLGIAVYSAWQRQRNAGVGPSLTTAPEAEPSPAESSDQRRGTVISHQTIRNQDGRVVFRGDVDVGPTLERIHHDERLPFSHDGIVFQNRERRLPQKPAGYYHEFVHPTPGLNGPGPQRIVIGHDGETYYTPDHYRTFQRLDE
jgi:ribonuclease T1